MFAAPSTVNGVESIAPSAQRNHGGALAAGIFRHLKPLEPAAAAIWRGIAGDGLGNQNERKSLKHYAGVRQRGKRLGARNGAQRGRSNSYRGGIISSRNAHGVTAAFVHATKEAATPCAICCRWDALPFAAAQRIYSALR